MKVEAGESRYLTLWGLFKRSDNATLTLTTATAQTIEVSSNRVTTTFIEFFLDETTLATANLPMTGELKVNGVVKRSIELEAATPVTSGDGVSQSYVDNLISGTVQKVKNYTAAGAADGFHQVVELDYDTLDTALPEPLQVKVRNAAGTLMKSLWMNESGLLRLWTIRKDEAALRAHAYSLSSTGPVIEVRGPWNQGQVQRWSINGQGQQMLGPDRVVAGVVVTLAAGEPVPTGLPAGTIIARTA